MEAIFKRRSVRKFTSDRISDQDMEKLLRAAMRAPSAGNEQPWEFIVLRDRETMVNVLEFHPYATMLKEADCAVVVCGNLERKKFTEDYWVQDCSAATQNLLLEAVELGLGAVWLGVYPLKERVAGFQKLLNLPDSVIPLNAVALGYPSIAPDPADTYVPGRIHWEKW